MLRGRVGLGQAVVFMVAVVWGKGKGIGVIIYVKVVAIPEGWSWPWWCGVV